MRYSIFALIIAYLFIAGCGSQRFMSSCEKGMQNLKPGIDFNPGKVVIRFNTKDQDSVKEVMKGKGYNFVTFLPGWHSTPNQLAEVDVPDGQEFKVVCRLKDEVIEEVDLDYIKN